MARQTIGTATGAILYRGPSRLDGAPIVVVATGLDGSSTNSKTGPMAQTWILRGDVTPVIAARHTGEDSSVCGQCPLRPMVAEKGAPVCYVNKGYGPRGVYDALMRGSYPELSAREVKAIADKRGVPIRFGSYGDPGAAPLELWRALDGKRHTGYSHQWRRFPGLRRLAMASADSLSDARQAWRKGWRTFRVIRSLDELQPNEIVCPASEEGGRKTTCAKCGLCNGATENDKRKSIAIIDHGPTAARRKAVLA